MWRPPPRSGNASRAGPSTTSSDPLPSASRPPEADTARLLAFFLLMEPVSDLICIAVTVFWIVLLIRVVVSLLVYFAGVRPPSTGVLRSGHEILYDVTEPV